MIDSVAGRIRRKKEWGSTVETAQVTINKCNRGQVLDGHPVTRFEVGLLDRELRQRDCTADLCASSNTLSYVKSL